MIFLEHSQLVEMTFHIKDVILLLSVLIPAGIVFALIKYRLNLIEKRVDEIIKKQDDFRKIIYSKLEDNNKSIHEIQLSIERLRSEILQKLIKK